MMILTSKKLVIIILVLNLATRVAPSCDYAAFTSKHSALKSPVCENFKPAITSAEKTEILKKHNTLRSRVARGEEKRGDPGPQPSGANIRELKWNDELSYVAQAWASQCRPSHDCKPCRKICSRGYTVGQNVYTIWQSASKDKSNVWDAAIQSWYNEVKYMTKDIVSQYRNITKGNMVGHYTQVVWAKSYEVGCGAVHFEDAGTKKLYVCNYGPAGNYVTRPVYKQGPPASKCPGAVSNTYRDLCA